MDLFGSKREDVFRTQYIKQQVSEALGLNENATVLVTELACEDEDCPDVETVVAVLQAGQPKLQVKVDFGIDVLSDEQVQDLCVSLRQMQAAQGQA